MVSTGLPSPKFHDQLSASHELLVKVTVRGVLQEKGGLAVKMGLGGRINIVSYIGDPGQPLYSGVNVIIKLPVS